MIKRRICFDARMWGHPGIGRYIRELCGQYLKSKGGEDFNFLGPASLRDYLTSMDGSPERSWGFDETRAGIYGFREQFEIPRKAKRSGLLHSPHFNVPVFYRGRLVVTIHDLIYFHDPKSSKSMLGKPYFFTLLREIEKKAAAVITVSDFTKRDLLTVCPKLKEENVTVIYEAPSTIFRKIDNANVLAGIRAKRSLHKPFVLYVGSLKRHKNLPMLIRAMERVRTEKVIPHELVLVGRHDPKNTELVDLLARHAFVRYLGELPDDELVGLYNLSDLFVLPSLREGFGLPLVEAMACGAPVIASDCSSIPEILGGAGILFDPERVDALAEVLYNVLTDNELRKKMSQSGFERARQFSWDKTATQTLRVYDRVLNG
jgi:glycosyltransferase involved in cell wall biosynthesis